MLKIISTESDDEEEEDDVKTGFKPQVILEPKVSLFEENIPCMSLLQGKFSVTLEEGTLRPNEKSSLEFLRCFYYPHGYNFSWK